MSKFIISSTRLYEAMKDCSQYKWIIKDGKLQIGNNGDPVDIMASITTSHNPVEYVMDVYRGDKIVKILKLLDEQPLTIKYEGNFIEIQSITI